MLGATRLARLARHGLTAALVCGGVAACEPWRDDGVATDSPQAAPMIEGTGAATAGLLKPPPPATAVRTVHKPQPAPPRPFRIQPYAPIASAWPLEMFGPQPPPVVEPVDVVGLSESEAEDLLGAPIERSWRPPSKVLRYASNDCTVDIYFYLDVAKDRFQALQIKAPDSAADESELKTCLGKVRDDHRTR
ncbi:MAG: hypothetical protein AB7P52_00715 [Alphaproteobacteria bacterium]